MDQIAAFWAMGQRQGACLVWTGTTDRKGYGRIQFDGRAWSTHRLSYVLSQGAIPPGLEVRHSCDNPPCFDWTHLSLGTTQQNNQDRVDRQRTHLAAQPGESNPAARLTASQVIEIRAAYASGTETHRSLGARYGVTYQTIGKIVRGQKWSVLPQP